ncbi:Protein MIZU-KUSSEI 1 [Linum perenne]
MSTIMTAKTSQDSFSLSRRYFNWKKKLLELHHGGITDHHYQEHEDEDEEEIILNNLRSSSKHFTSNYDQPDPHPYPSPKKNNLSTKLRSALTAFGARGGNCSSRNSGLGNRVVGTLFGYRRGHVHFAFQEDPKQRPAFLIEMATPTSVLVKEMASGLVRIALECEKSSCNGDKRRKKKLLEEGMWRSYCNGKKSGYAIRRECGEEEWRVLTAVGPISMGAGVLPAEEEKEVGELMYMRARFERVVGSKDSEAFYMMNPDGSGGPELSLYLLRV